MGTEVSIRQSAIRQWDPGFQKLVKTTVLKPKNREATDAELALLAEHAVRTGLDPMSRQIYGIYRKQNGQERMTLQVGIDGLRAIAERTGKYLGQSGPFWFDGTDWTDVWLSKDLPKAAKVVVRKVVGGHISETPAVAHYDEYVPLFNGKPLGLWEDKPALMLAKCAEALALRKAFPQDMSGLYTDDEMGRADVQEPAPIAELREIVSAEHAIAESHSDVIVDTAPVYGDHGLLKFMASAIRAKKKTALSAAQMEAWKTEAEASEDGYETVRSALAAVFTDLGGDVDALMAQYEQRAAA